MLGVTTGLPGVGAVTYQSQPRNVFYQGEQFSRMLAGPLTIDGTACSNPDNSPYDWLLFAGTILGRNTATKKYETSIIGLTSGAIAAGAEALSVSVAVAKEIVRRIGTSGQLKLIGPPTAAGIVAVQVLSFTAVNTGTGAITITNTNTPAVNCVQTVAIAGTLSAGSYSIRFPSLNKETGPIAYDASIANVQTALDNALGGANVVVAGGTAQSAMTLTFSGAGVTGAAQLPVVIDEGGLTGATGVTVTMTTAGSAAVDSVKAAIAGSIVAPNDSASTPATVITDPYGVKVVDVMNTNRVDVFNCRLWGGGGVINTAYLVNYPTDSSLQAWVKAGIRLVSPDAQFSDDIVMA